MNNADLSKFATNLTHLLDVIDSNSKLVNDISETTRKIILKDPVAMDKSILEYIIKNNLGESMYDRIRKIYVEIIST